MAALKGTVWCPLQAQKVNYILRNQNTVKNTLKPTEKIAADKEDKQNNQKDDERRNPGKVPDAIINLSHYNLPIVFVEVSGLPNHPNHQHFVGDKIKLAKQLKSIIKKIRRSITYGDEGLYEHISLIGIQVYLNKVYVYCLSQPSRGIYVFENIMSFDLVCSPGLVSSFTPRLLKHLWKIKTLVADSALLVEDYLNSDSGYNSSDKSDDSRDTIHTSPKKQRDKLHDFAVVCIIICFYLFV